MVVEVPSNVLVVPFCTVVEYDLSTFICTTLPQVLLADIGLACMQASPDRAHGARVQIVYRLEENRRKN